MTTNPRNLTVDARSAILRERIRDHLARTGGRRGSEQQAREDFIHEVIRRGRAEHMRLWNSENKSLFDQAMQSLVTILEEKSVYNPTLKRWNTGRNVHWVLDLWEITLDHATRGTPTHADREQPEDALQPEVPVDGPGDGVKVVRKRASKLSMRIVEAYLAGDEDAIMEIAAEVEKLEASAQRL